MNGKTKLETHIAEELQRYKDVYFPIRSSLLRRMLVTMCACKKMHPNPDDEFCDPSVGPSDQIISEYMTRFRIARQHREMPCEDDPVLVERMYPDGYLILNGHHRWAAALSLGFKRFPVSVVKLTQESEIKKILAHSKCDRRATFDLNEVLLLPEHGEAAEKPLPWPLNRRYRDALRRGVPALFNFLSANNYDIWVYTDKYYSSEHIRHFFALHHARVTGVITGLGRKTRVGNSIRAKIDALMAEKYRITLHIDNATLLSTNRTTRQYEEYSLDEASGWAQQITEIVRKIDKK